MTNYDFDRFSVLVVDDNGYICSLLVQCLRALGVGTVFPASNGAEAISVLRLVDEDPRRAGTAQIDVIVSDWRMSPVDGLMLLRWVRRHEESPNRFVPFILVTGYADQDCVAEARDLGVTEIVAKPFSVSSVAERVLELLDRPRQFVQTPEYFGPDRRRHRPAPPSDGERRLAAEQDIEVIYDPGR